MINQTRFINLQAHIDTVLSFVPGINCITGDSDVGKSSIIRGIKWVVLNRPSGDELRRHHTKKTTVEIDGVTKLRTASKHQYVLNSQVFKALRTDVPPEITRALRLSEVNFQEQHQQYFLIADSPGQVAKTLNKVADLQVIDLSLASVKQKVRESKAHKKFLDEDQKKNSENIEALEWVRGADKEYKEIEDLEHRASTISILPLSDKIHTVEELRDKFQQIPMVEPSLARLDDALRDIDVDLSLEILIKEVEDNQVVIPDPDEDLKKITASVENLQVDVTRLADLIEKVEESDTSGYPETIDDPGPVIENLTTLAAGISSLTETISELVIAEDCWEESIRLFDQKKAAYEERRKEIGVCPLCENKI